LPEGPLFELTGVGFGFGGPPVLAGVDLSLAPGRFHGIVGPNGAGKTTLLDLLAGLKRPGQGRVLLSGRPLETRGRGELARVLALVPQEYAVNFPFTVEEVVMMGRHPHIPRFGAPSDQDRRLVKRALDLMGLADLAGKQVTQLSGGEKQRVILARALAQDTAALLLDEPTANLDIHHALSALAVVAGRVRTEGATAVAVMHDLNLAAAYCDRLVLLKEGRVLAVGPTGQVLTAANLALAFGVEARVRDDDFSGAKTVVFRLERMDA